MSPNESPVQAVGRALVTGWVFEQVLLVVILGVIPRARGYDLSDDLFAYWVEVLLLHLLCDSLSDLELLGRVVEDRGTVLSSRIRSLAVLGRWVMRPVEEFNKLVVANLARVEFDSHSLSMVRRPCADLLVARVRDIFLPASVTDRRLEDTLVLVDGIMLQKYMLDAPEAARRERRDFRLSPFSGSQRSDLQLCVCVTRCT